MSDDGAIGHMSAIPLTSDRIRVDGKGFVLCANSWPSKVQQGRPVWCDGHRAPVWVAKSRSLIFIELDTISMFVNELMMITAHQSGIFESSFTAIGPVLDMVSFQE